MPINAHPDFIAAEGEYHNAYTLEEKIKALQKMISVAPSHKGSENLRAQLKTRLKKFKEQLAKSKKSGKSSKVGIKKEDIQAVIIGKTNSGKSSLLKALTNAFPKISETEFETKKPTIGMTPFSGTHIQLVENPAIDSDYYDRGIPHTADVLLIVVNSIEDIKPILEELAPHKGKKLIVFNNKENLNERKIEAALKSKRYNYIITDLTDALEELKEKIFIASNKIRIYTKEPGKTIEQKSARPYILDQETSVKDVAEKILKGFSKNIKEAKIWGPSSKFPGQEVGLKHKLKDLDIVEFRTK